MKELETRIIQDGKIINNEILKIDLCYEKK